MSNRADVVANAVEAGLQTAISQTGPGIMTKFLLIAEVIDEDGEIELTGRVLDLTDWDALGMLQKEMRRRG